MNKEKRTAGQIWYGIDFGKDPVWRANHDNIDKFVGYMIEKQSDQEEIDNLQRIVTQYLNGVAEIIYGDEEALQFGLTHQKGIIVSVNEDPRFSRNEVDTISHNESNIRSDLKRVCFDMDIEFSEPKYHLTGLSK